MVGPLNKDNFNQTLQRFTTAELENLVEKFPYFQQAHLLLAKKYQQQNHPKFDQQLQLAALYTQDRELLFSIFNEKNDKVFLSEVPKTVKAEIPVVPVIEQLQVVAPEVIGEIVEPVIEGPVTVLEPLIEERMEEVKTEEEIKAFKPEVEPQIEQREEFSTNEPHTFDEWLKAFGTSKKIEIELKSQEIPREPEKQDEELEKLYAANIPVNLQELVEEETHYSKGLDKFIEEQIQKHKAPTVKIKASDTELAPELVTETMAKVYEMQKKYTRAIRCYEILALKYPEKNDFFAARINYLKNIV